MTSIFLSLLYRSTKGELMSNVDEWLPERIILEAYAGSKVYGTERRDSDVDLRGVAIPPREYFLGLDNFKHKRGEDPDRMIHGIHTWARLALQGNPNVLELLWTPDNYFVKMSDAGLRLVANRDLLLAKHVKARYFGYAKGQLTRMTKLNKNANTNPKRVWMIEKYGFDLKNAAHLVRLMRMCLEILTEETLYVQRYDAKDLLNILDGKWSYNKIIEEMRRLEHLVDEAMITTKLPTKPDRKKFNDLIIEIVSDAI